MEEYSGGNSKTKKIRGGGLLHTHSNIFTRNIFKNSLGSNLQKQTPQRPAQENTIHTNTTKEPTSERQITEQNKGGESLKIHLKIYFKNFFQMLIYQGFEEFSSGVGSGVY
ncbi:hypothetical protein P5609_001350 [Bacillus licheniformis]|uniref:hypothetical protein n=1 Tax=Bacillus licheniformis TaxID=1402 RepID=UPI00018C804E|nr:hypothetical protein [Bacillus licheniformis]MDH3162335.1 hypothetical protein [Bacillus licheniformis]MED4409021.1 hypothetical protein [Bacillus licheniformis]QDL76924.1 hypothetical protein D9Y32_05355 [Bacillus licheniformis]